MSPEQLMQAASAAGFHGRAWVPGAAAPSAPAQTERSATARVQELQSLRDQDLITVEDFERRKKQIIDEICRHRDRCAAEPQTPDRTRPDVARQYELLLALKDRYDPANLFRLNQNIRPSELSAA